MNKIALVTDYGLNDHYVGVIKGVIKTINKNTEIIDICNNIDLGDINAANFIIAQSFKYFPENTIFLCIIDPGVGSDRLPVIIKTNKYYFVGPNNGIFSYIIDNENIEKVIVIDNQKYFLKPISNTFHGRDIFAPITAHLSLGLKPEKFGKEIEKSKLISFTFNDIEIIENQIIGKIIYVDGFGNLISNIKENIIKYDYEKCLINIGNIEISGIKKTFSDVAVNSIVTYFGSSNYLEFALNNGNLNKKYPELKKEKVIISYID